LVGTARPSRAALEGRRAQRGRPHSAALAAGYRSTDEDTIAPLRRLAAHYPDGVTIKDRFNGDAGEDFLPMREAIRGLGVSRQTVLQRLKRGELAAVHVTPGKQKGLRIKVIGQQFDLFDPIS
jgi:hypothetical protein